MFLEQRLANPKQAHSEAGLFWISNVMYGGSPPAPPPPPKPPDYAAANRAGVIADVQTLGARKAIENAAKFGGKAMAFGVEERIDKDGNKAYYQLFNEDGKRYAAGREVKVSEKEAIIDFSGMSDIDAARELADFQRKESDANTRFQIDLGKKYSSEVVSEARRQLQELDPSGFALREQFGRILQDELAAGSELTPDEQRQVSQSVRGAQVARGNIYGGAPIAQEAIARYNVGEQKQQQRMANVQSYLGLNPIVQQAGGLSSLQQGPVAYQPTPVPQGVNINPMAGQIGTNFALGVYGNQTSQYNAQLDYQASTYASSQQNSPLKWITGIGQTIGGLI
ncbi:MAG: hypothetical protein EBZ69_01280 [Alphaproteobacteria bacterium]|nr:hypothetical protein [Alphaproteobacteria bacterium]NDG03054.1 hypothetical protein [Synechococcaceae bacterium WBB_34_004]